MATPGTLDFDASASRYDCCTHNTSKEPDAAEQGLPAADGEPTGRDTVRSGTFVREQGSSWEEKRVVV